MKYITKPINLFIIMFLLLHAKLVDAQGIIIAHEQNQTEVFSDSALTASLIDDIKQKYTKVIIHLGQAQVFSKGNIYTNEVNKKNLVYFCNSLESANIPVFLWFFDSFSSDAFLKLYKNYKVMADDNIAVIKSLNLMYSGIVTDMEWINLPTGNNNEKFSEIMLYLKSKLPEKKIFYFASLIDSEKENISRGYNMSELKKFDIQPISMLYLKDGGFIVINKKIVPQLNDSRVRQLRKYFQKNKIGVAVSFEGAGIVIKADLSSVAYTFFNSNDTISNNSKELRKIVKKNYEIILYESLGKYQDNTKGHKGEKIWVFRVLPKILINDDYIWEYFRLIN